MNKPQSLRQHLLRALPDLNNDPERLLVFLDEGKIVTTAAPNLAFEYHYTLNLILTDFAGHADLVIIPILDWLTRNQPDLLANPEHQRDGFKFEAELLNHSTVDLAIKLQLTERVGVEQQNGKRVAVHYEEPPLTPDEDVGHWELYVHGDKVTEWSAT